MILGACHREARVCPFGIAEPLVISYTDFRYCQARRPSFLISDATSTNIRIDMVLAVDRIKTVGAPRVRLAGLSSCLCEGARLKSAPLDRIDSQDR